MPYPPTPLSAACPPCPPSGGGDVLDPRRSDEELIAYTLIQIWALTTGRTPRDDVPPDELTADELIAFWADPFMEVQP